MDQAEQVQGIHIVRALSENLAIKHLRIVKPAVLMVRECKF
jgi:hypothetical protein